MGCGRRPRGPVRAGPSRQSRTAVAAVAEGFREQVDALGLRGRHVLVALSGGRDSTALLHLFRFATDLQVSAAHLDHAMRPESAADARWVAGLCAAWDVLLISARSERTMHTEADARRERHAFLRSAARSVGAGQIALAHHLDDQAETVLFRAVRGTGIAGLRGMAPAGPGPLVRPLVGFTRAEIAEYARGVGLRWREDASNRDLSRARNRLRHDILPRLERGIAPGARRSLARLAGHAREQQAALDAALAGFAALAATREANGGLVLHRAVFREHPRLAPFLLRGALGSLAERISAAGTRLGVQFITESPSGRTLELPGGLRLLAEFDQVRVLHAAEAPLPDCPLRILGEAGSGTAVLGGRAIRAAWRVAPADARLQGEEAFGWSAGSEFEIRGPLPGDRIRLGSGTRTLKRLWNDHRIPRSRRALTPVLVDSTGAVLWVVGVARSVDAMPHPDENALLIRTTDD